MGKEVLFNIQRSLGMNPKIIDLIHEKPRYHLNGHGHECGSFKASRDSWSYSKLIEKILKIFSQRNSLDEFVLYDLGAGSSLTTLSAINSTSILPKKIVAIDINGEAILSSKVNVEIEGYSSLYSFQEVSLSDYINESSGLPYAIVSNPPYISCQRDLEYNPCFSAINGGPDGLKFYKQILKNKIHPIGTLLGLHLSSLTFLKGFMDMIQGDYNIIDIDIFKVPFGLYTSQDEVKNYLLDLRKLNKVFFEERDGSFEYFIISLVLEKI